MDALGAAREVERLIKYALRQGLMDETDVIPSRNSLLDVLNISEPYNAGVEDDVPERPSAILEALLDYAWQEGMMEGNTLNIRDLFDTKIMGLLMPRESEVVRNFSDRAAREGIDKATDYFYRLSISSNYIRMDRVDKNLYWERDTGYGPLEITINLSKPEKDPRDIAAARRVPQIGYPKCLPP
jgi:UDPglucose--hexose-1-phosphate uridylyltransferase